MLAGARDPGDALADQRPARRALDPEQDAVRARLPAKALRAVRDGQRTRRTALAAMAIGLDPVDQLADLRFPARGLRVGRISANSGSA
jgi:hypothetical protein